MVFIGTGVVATAVLTDAQVGLWQVAVVWGIGVALAIYATAAVSGTHLNPAVTLTFVLLSPKQFSWRHVLPFWLAQLIGAMLAGALVFALFHNFIEAYEVKNALVRGHLAVSSPQ